MPSLGLSESSVTTGTGWTVTGTPYPCVGSPEPTGTPTGTLVINFVAPGGGLPSNATVTGYSLTISRDASAGGNVWDTSITVTVGGKGLSNEAATSTLWPSTTGDASYGGTNDLWGDAAPTYTAVNSTGGAVGIAIHTDGTAGLGYVRSVGLTVNYVTSANQVIPHALVLRPHTWETLTQ